MTHNTRHSLRYWVGAIGASLLGSATACYAGIVEYNAEAERVRAQGGGFVDGRVPFELPIYAALGAFAGWLVFRVAVALWFRTAGPPR
jgi:hypothetical protein